MGLDMYLLSGTGVGTKEETLKSSDGKTHKFNYEYVINEEEVYYWRKANQIHLWFVNNVQGGKDDCGIYEVGVDDLDKLYKVCKDVYKKRDEEYSMKMLPTTSGFFFGGTRYDEEYYNNIKETYKMIKDLFKDKSALDSKYYYQSSW